MASARDCVLEGASETPDSCSVCTLAYQFPAQAFPRPQWDQRFTSKFKFRRYLPAFFLQRNTVPVTRQPVEIRAMKAGECFQLIQRACLFKDFRIKLDRRVGGINTCAAAGIFLCGSGMGCAICSKEKFRVAAGGGFYQFSPMSFTLQHGKTIMVRVDTALKQGVAVEQHMMNGDGGGNMVRGGDDEINCL